MHWLGVWKNFKLEDVDDVHSDDAGSGYDDDVDGGARDEVGSRRKAVP